MVFPISFLVWHYTGGILDSAHSMILIARHIFRVFNIIGLLSTLFSPWKRDISLRTWVGFHPVEELNRLFMNLFSRVIGAIIRLFVVFTGLFVLFCFVPLSVAVFVLWTIAIPGIVFCGFLFLARGGLDEGFLTVLALFGVALMLSFRAYMDRLPETFLPRDRRDLMAKPYFSRVLGRLGIERKSFRREDWESDEAFESRLAELNVSREAWGEIVAHEALLWEIRARAAKPLLWENLRKAVPIGRGWQFAYTVKLDRYAADLSQGDPTEYSKLHLFGRDDELRVGSLLLSRPGQKSFLLVGEPGVGKKTFIHAFARKIREGDITGFDHLRFLLFDLGVAVGEAENRGEDVENTVRELFYQAAYAGNVVLVIEGIDRFLGSGESKHTNLAAVFAEFLALPSFRVIGTIGSSRYHELIRSDEPALKFFEAIHLREPEPSDTIRIILNILTPVERKGVMFTWKALESIVELSGQYEWDTPYPEKAIDLAQEVLLEHQSSPRGPFITKEAVAAFVAMKTGIPSGVLGEDERERLLRLEEILHLRVVGQDEAVRQVSEALRRARAGFGNPNRPLGSFLFLGPTGVGKTETAKALSEAYFGDETRMVRLDMSEFQSGDAVERLIGSSASGEEGQLVSLMKDHPFSVLLLDEIEKAYPKALDLFLQVLDEGFVTDGFGRKVNFRKSIIIATSNASSGLIAELLGHGASVEAAKQEVIADIGKQGTFRMEFLNRFDGIIFFSPLAETELMEVVGIKLEALAKRLKKEKNITIGFSPDVAREIVARGYDPVFGARSLNRFLEDKIEDFIARKVIEGSVVEGGTLSVSADDIA